MNVARRLICVGKFAGAFGVRGETRLVSYCANPESITDYGPLITRQGRSFTVRISGKSGNALRARIDGVRTREHAETLKGIFLFAERDRLPDLESEEFYHADLVGLPVIDPNGAKLGRIKSIFNNGAGDLLEIEPDDGSSAELVPFTRAAVPTVDLEEGKIVIDWPHAFGST